MRSWRICIWGASITGGSAATDGGWVHDLLVACRTQRKDISVFNLGVSGATSTHLLERFQVEAKARQPDIVVFSIGTNDTQIQKGETAYRVPPDEFESNVRQLVSWAKDWTKTIIVIGILDIDENVEYDEHLTLSNSSISKYNEILKHVSVDEGCLFVDTSGILEPTDYFDGLHPNDDGHDKIFEHIIKTIPVNDWLPDAPEGQIKRPQDR